ncbi:hypothetical protein SAMN04487899_11059 [Segatella bryantii]|nr:hypothetical protein SAMN04487899_11059 [Segatella bryantii]
MTKWSISLDTIDSTISWHNLNIFHRLRQSMYAFISADTLTLSTSHLLTLGKVIHG